MNLNAVVLTLSLFLFSQFAFAASPYVIMKDNGGQILAALSDRNTQPSKLYRVNHLAPRGSSVLTPSGDLAQSGIVYVMHAATGSMGAFGKSTEPTTESLRTSIANSVALANLVGVNRIAIPLVGGGIFLSRLNKTQPQVALEILKGASMVKSKVEIVLVGYTDPEYQAFLSAVQNRRFSKSFLSRVAVVEGSIVDFSVHNAPAIVNAANMEVMFGGGLSGVIGKASGKTAEIDATAAELLKKYYHR